MSFLPSAVQTYEKNEIIGKKVKTIQIIGKITDIIISVLNNGFSITVIIIKLNGKSF